MIYELTLACGWQADRLSAEALYVGLATDTGFFRFNSTNVRAHAIAADSRGNVYVAESGGGRRVQRFSPTVD